MTLLFTILAVGLLTVRGGLFHNRLVLDIATWVRAAGFQVEIESPRQLPDGGWDFVDALARRGAITLAIEVETTPRYALVNARKALLSGLPLWVVVPSRSVRQAIRSTLSRKLPLPEQQRIWIFLFAEVPQALTGFCSQSFPGEFPSEIWKNNRLDRARQGV